MKVKRSRALARGVAALSALMIVVGGVTFAALQSERAVVKGNSIQTATANLQLSSDATNFSSTIDGFAFGNLIPGGAASPTSGYPLYLKDAGSTPLSLMLSVNEAVTNADNVSLAGVHVILTPIGGGAPQTFSLQELISANPHGGVALKASNHMMPGEVDGYRLQFSMDGEAVFGPGASLSNIDFNFSAPAVM